MLSEGFVGARTRGQVIGLGLLVLAVVVAIDLALSERALFDEWHPDASWPFIVRSAGLAMAAALIMVGARQIALAALPEIEPPPLSDPTSVFVATGISLVMGLGSAMLLVVSPTILTDLVQEDRLIEWASAGFCFIAAALLAGAAIRWWQRSGHWLTIAALAALGCLFLLVGLEEVSWFQRVLGVETPQAFIDRNGQQELNLHNFATVASGNVFFAGAFAFCVALPFVLGDRRLPMSLAWMAPVMPSLAVLYSSAIATAIVFTMWNVILIQLTFWMSLVAMLLAGFNGHASRPGLLVGAAMTIVSIVFLAAGDTMIRDWDDTEVRELVIPFNLMVYGLGIRKVASRPAQLSTKPS